MSSADRTALIDALNAEAKNSGRIGALLATAEHRKKMMTDKVAGELRRLGLADGSTMKAGAKKYAVYEIDQAAKKSGWQTTCCMVLKSELNTLGLLAD